MPFRSWCTVCQRAKGQHQHHKGNQKLTSVVQLDHSFYKVPGGETHNLKVLNFVEAITSTSGAVIVPDLSANQVAIKALKKFIAVDGFTKSVLQCDGHSGLRALQEQVGQEMSLPTQISPPYSHQSQGTVERFHKTLYGQVRAIKIGLADNLNVDADHLDAAFMPWIIQHATFQINRSWSDQMGRPHLRRYSRSLRGHQFFILGSVLLLTFSRNPQLKSCRFVPHLESHLDFG